MPRRVNISRTLDWLSILIYVTLIIIGWFNVYASSYDPESKQTFFAQVQGKQMLWIITSFVIAIFVIVIDFRAYHAFAYYIYGIAILALIITAIFAPEVNGARAWISISGYKFQSGEFAKFAVNLALAKYLSTFDVKILRLNSLITLAAILLLPITIILFQKDTGSALIYIIFIIIFYREGLYWWIPALGIYAVVLFVLGRVYHDNLRYIIFILSIILFFYYLIDTKNLKRFGFGLIIFIVIASIYEGFNQIFNLKMSFEKNLIICIILSSLVYLGIAIQKKIKLLYTLVPLLLCSIIFIYSIDYIFNNILEKHQQKRINVALRIDDDEKGSGYNVNQSIIAIGSGGISGKGFLEGTQTKFNFLPAKSTDFIFCTVGEEWGFLGSFVVIGLFIFLLLRLIFLAERQRSAFSRIFGYGVLSILFFHFIINIGMTIGLMPVIGVPLPFFSYGGSSLWSFTILLFIFLRLDASRTELL